MLIVDIFQSILNYHELIDQINLCNLNTHVRKYLKIYYLHKIPVKHKKKLTQEVLEQNKFSNLITLDVSYRVNIKSVNHLSNSLKLLICKNLSKKKEILGQEGISGLKVLEILIARGNSQITCVNHLADCLKVLDCSYDDGAKSGISQKGISKLKKLEKLIAFDNKKIRFVKHLKNTLEYLDCSGDCKIIREDIDELDKLKFLNIQYREDIELIKNKNSLKKIISSDTVKVMTKNPLEMVVDRYKQYFNQEELLISHKFIK